MYTLLLCFLSHRLQSYKIQELVIQYNIIVDGAKEKLFLAKRKESNYIIMPI